VRIVTVGHSMLPLHVHPSRKDFATVKCYEFATVNEIVESADAVSYLGQFPFDQKRASKVIGG
jgi:hypothetical protein